MEELGRTLASGATGGLAEMVVVCAPRSPGGWRMLASMIAFVLLAWAFAPSKARDAREARAPRAPRRR